MDKASLLFKRIMLGLLMLLLALMLGLMLRVGLGAKSYLAAMAAGALWAGGLVWLRRRRAGRGKAPLGAGLSGKKAAVLTALGCFALNLLWVLVIRIEPFSDYETYWQTAVALAEGTAIPTPWYIAMYPHILGTATFLSVFVRLFGASVLAVTVVNVVLTTLSCLLVYGITRTLCERTAALWAALLWAVCPCKLMINSLVFSEPLYTCLILLFLYLLVRLDAAPARAPGGFVSALGWGAGLGVLLAAVNIVRPIAAILVIAMVIWLFLLRGRGTAWGRWLALLAALLAVYVLVGRLWDRHVEAVLGMAPAAVPVYNIYVGFNEATRGQWSAEDMDLLFSYFNAGATTSEAQRAMLPHLQQRLAAGIDYPALFADKLIAFLGNDELGGYTYRFTRPESFYKPLMVLGNVFYYGVVYLGLAGLARSFRARRLTAGQLLPLYALGLTLAHMLVEVSNRYHYSLIPLFIIFAAVALAPADNSRRLS